MTDFENLKSDDQMYREMADFLSDIALEHCKECPRRPHCWANPEMGAAVTINTVMRESFHYDAIVAYTTMKLISKISKIKAESVGDFLKQEGKNDI